VLPPARPPFFFASVGLGCEGNGWLSPRRHSLGPSRFRVVFPVGGRMVEVSPVLWNKVLRPFLRLVVIRSDAGDGLVRLGSSGSKTKWELRIWADLVQEFVFFLLWSCCFSS